VWMVLAGLALVSVAVLTSVGSNLDIFGKDIHGGIRWVAALVTVVLTAVVLGTMMRLSTPQDERWREVLPGATFIAIGWQLLQVVGGVYVEHVIKRASQMNAVFATVLGLVALLYIGTVIAMLGLELNTVLAKRLYPRALLTPFTDAVDLTDADKRVYREYAQAQRHKGFERISVNFDDQAE
jgi:membrane protein